MHVHITVDHFKLLSASLSKRGLVHNHSYENEFNLHVNEISFSYERMSTKTCFEEEAKGNSEMTKDSIGRTFACDIGKPIIEGREKGTLIIIIIIQ